MIRKDTEDVKQTWYRCADTVLLGAASTLLCLRYQSCQRGVALEIDGRILALFVIAGGSQSIANLTNKS